MSEKRTIVLVHASEDQNMASNLSRLVNNLGFAPVMASETKEPSFVILCLSSHAVGKGGLVQRDFRLMLEHCAGMLGDDTILIPLRLYPYQIPDVRVGRINLRNLQWIDAFKGDSLRSLLSLLGINNVYNTIPTNDIFMDNELADSLLLVYGRTCSILTALSGETRGIILYSAGNIPMPGPGDKTPCFVKKLEAAHSYMENRVDGSKLVIIPGGEFLMGDPDMPVNFNDQLPSLPHRVAFTDSYMISQHLITNEQFAIFLSEQNPGSLQNSLPLYPAGLDKHPVTNVTWDEAAAYCKWAGGRLPAEDEWEKAARGLDGRPFPWGWEEPDNHNCNFGNLNGQTTEIGQLPLGISPFACYDCAGNVWEWTSSTASQQAAPGDLKHYIVKGGSFADPAPCCRVGGRYYDVSNNRTPMRGFRLVVDGSR